MPGLFAPISNELRPFDFNWSFRPSVELAIKSARFAVAAGGSSFDGRYRPYLRIYHLHGEWITPAFAVDDPPGPEPGQGAIFTSLASFFHPGLGKELLVVAWSITPTLLPSGSLAPSSGVKFKVFDWEGNTVYPTTHVDGAATYAVSAAATDRRIVLTWHRQQRVYLRSWLPGGSSESSGPILVSPTTTAGDFAPRMAKVVWNGKDYAAVSWTRKDTSGLLPCWKMFRLDGGPVAVASQIPVGTSPHQMPDLLDSEGNGVGLFNCGSKLMLLQTFFTRPDAVAERGLCRRCIRPPGF